MHAVTDVNCCVTHQTPNIMLPHSTDQPEKNAHFLLRHIVDAALRLRVFYKNPGGINKEENYNKKLHLFINKNLRETGWRMENKTDDPAAILIKEGKENRAVVESFLMQGRNIATVKRHLKKIWMAEPSCTLYFLVIFCRVSEALFIRNWDGYRTDINASIHFPDQYQLQAPGLEEIADPPGNDQVRIAKSLHDQSCTLYHIFIHTS